jgi:hypothetical protein
MPEEYFISFKRLILGRPKIFNNDLVPKGAPPPHKKKLLMINNPISDRVMHKQFGLYSVRLGLATKGSGSQIILLQRIRNNGFLYLHILAYRLGNTVFALNCYFDVVPVARLEAFRTLKLYELDSLRALKLSRLDNFRTLKPKGQIGVC